MSHYLPITDYFVQYKTKQEALFHYLRDRILSGHLISHEQLPPTRELASQLQLSRGTVNNVYDMLTAQGYLYTITGSGTFVSPVITQAHTESIKKIKQPRLSNWGDRALKSSGLLTYTDNRLKPIYNESYEPLSFLVNQVNVAHFPFASWNKALYEHTRKQIDLNDMRAIPPEGDITLRQAIAQHLSQQRGFKCEFDQIFIVNGSLQALALLSHLFINEGDYVALENPHYSGMRAAVEVLGGHIDTYPVDDQGIVFSAKRNSYKLIYLTPNRQFPTGAVLSMKRRQSLLEWAAKHDCFLIEDDYDSEFAFQARPLEPLKALDRFEQVIYIGTFSRTMMQHIRLGYVVLPKLLIEPFRAAKMMFERLPTAAVQQRALASFMLNGQYNRHLRRLKRLYRERAALFMSLLTSKLHHMFYVFPLHAGLHIYVEWIAAPHLFEPFLSTCHKLNVQIASASRMYLSDERQTICLGYAQLSPLQIEEGINRLLLAYDTIVSSSSQ